MSIFGDAWDTVSGAAGDVWKGIKGATDTDVNYTPDPGAFDYGGTPGGLAARDAELRGMSGGAQGRAGARVDYSQANQDYAAQRGVDAQQGQFGNYLQDVMMGRAGPSLAEQQMKAGTDQSIAAQMAMANSARGGYGVAAAQRQAANQGAAMQQQNVVNTGMARAQEQMQARSQYGQQLQAQRAQQLQAMGYSAQQAQYQAGLEQQQHGLNDQYQLGVEGLRNQAGLGQLQAQTAGQNLKFQGAAADAKEKSAKLAAAMGAAQGLVQSGIQSDERGKFDIEPQGTPVLGGMLRGLLGAPPGSAESSGASNPNGPYSYGDYPGGPTGAGVLSSRSSGGFANPNRYGDAQDVASDARAKTAKDHHGDAADAFLSTLAHSSSTFAYRDPTREPRSSPTGGRYLGVMAQDVESAPEIGHQLVSDTPHGKVLEIPAMVSALAGGTGRLAQRHEDLEMRLRRLEHAKGLG